MCPEIFGHDIFHDISRKGLLQAGSRKEGDHNNITKQEEPAILPLPGEWIEFAQIDKYF